MQDPVDTSAEEKQESQTVGATETTEATAEDVAVQQGEFSTLSSTSEGIGGNGNIDMLMDLELPVWVELGRVKMFVKDILELGPGAVVELNKFSGEPVDLFVNNKKFAEGEVVVVDQNFGVRITALVGPSERLSTIQ